MVFLSTIRAIVVLVSQTEFLFVNNYLFIENSKEIMVMYFVNIKITTKKIKTGNLVTSCLQRLRVRIV